MGRGHGRAGSLLPRLPDRSHVLIGLDGGGVEVFRINLPGRGHAAAAHPRPPLAVAFARRPERFAFVVHCAERAGITGLAAPEGRYFYGHGAFLADGARPFTERNDDDAGTGRIGVREAKHGFARIGEVASGGVGPHDVKLAADGASPVVANGGARTRLSSDRAKLNAPTMRPNAVFLSAADGRILDLIEPEADRRFASPRRLAASRGRRGRVLRRRRPARGSRAETPPLVGVFARGGRIEWLEAALPSLWLRLQAYVGSVARTSGGGVVATSPRGGLALRYHPSVPEAFETAAAPDVCGAAAKGRDALLTTGRGIVARWPAEGGLQLRLSPGDPLAFDNHLVGV